MGRLPLLSMPFLAPPLQGRVFAPHFLMPVCEELRAQVFPKFTLQMQHAQQQVRVGHAVKKGRGWELPRCS